MATQKEMKSKRTKLVEKFISPENHTERIADLYDTFDVLDTALGKAEQRIYKLEVRIF